MAFAWIARLLGAFHDRYWCCVTVVPKDNVEIALSITSGARTVEASLCITIIVIASLQVYTFN